MDGKDEVYDDVVQEISDLEKSLDSQLSKFEKKLGCAQWYNHAVVYSYLYSCTLSWWHSGTGNKVMFFLNCSGAADGPILQEIYLVQTKANQDVPDDWIKSGATKVG